MDGAGRLYVCERGADRVAVYDPAGTSLAAIPVKAPHAVAVHRRTGAVYVVGGNTVSKFAGPEGAKAVWTMDLPPVPGGTRPVFALDDGAERPILWLGQPQQMDWCKYILIRVEDLGEKPGEAREISDYAKRGLHSPVHLAADPVRDEVYVREWRGNWRGQAFVRFAAQGRRTNVPLSGNELAVGPDGLLYTRSFRGAEAGTWIQRFTHEGKVVPFPEANDIQMGKEGFWVDGSLRGATAIGMKGFDVAPSGDLYIMRYYSCRGGNRRQMAEKGYQFPQPWPTTWEALRPLVDVYHGVGSPKTTDLIRFFRQGAAGIRVDRQGNIYVADHIKPKGQYYPPEIADQLPAPNDAATYWDWPHGFQNWYLFNYGTLFKFAPAGGRIEPAEADDPGALMAGTRGKTFQYVTVTGALWQRPGIAPVPADTDRGHGGGCVCANSRFDLDAFDRIFVPDVNLFQVRVLDTNGNELTRFGRYGNPDCQGPEIALNWPAYVGCTREAVYVCDNLNRRIVRVTLGYAATAECRPE